HRAAGAEGGHGRGPGGPAGRDQGEAGGAGEGREGGRRRPEGEAQGTARAPEEARRRGGGGSSACPSAAGTERCVLTLPCPPVSPAVRQRDLFFQWMSGPSAW